MIVDFIREHANHTPAEGGLRWGVEPICTVLSEHGVTIAPSTYYEWRDKLPTKRQQRDTVLLQHIRRVHADNFGVYGPRKVWLSLNREGIPVARCTIERLMKAAGLAGVVRGKVKRTTIAGVGPRPDDLVKRKFEPLAPNRLWVADFTYVSTWAGWVFVAFVIDAYARRILGWRTATSMTTELVLDAIEQAISTRQQDNRDQFDDLVAHNDRGVQYLSVAYGQRLADAGITPSVSAVGSSYDNALAESINGLYKTEVIRRQGPWRNLDTVEIAATRMCSATGTKGPLQRRCDTPLAGRRSGRRQSARTQSRGRAGDIAAGRGKPRSPRQARTGPGCGGRWRWPKLPRVAGRQSGGLDLFGVSTSRSDGPAPRPIPGGARC